MHTPAGVRSPPRSAARGRSTIPPQDDNRHGRDCGRHRLQEHRYTRVGREDYVWLALRDTSDEFGGTFGVDLRGMPSHGQIAAFLVTEIPELVEECGPVSRLLPGRAIDCINMRQDCKEVSLDRLLRALQTATPLLIQQFL